MKLNKAHWLGIIAGLVIILIDIIFFRQDKQINIFYFLLGIGVVIMVLPFMIALFLENKREKEVNQMFLEFSRDLAESVNTGTPISKSIVNLRSKNYGALSPHVQKLANQISIGVPVSHAFENFAYDIDSPVIKRATTLIREAERAGGEIDYILESVAHSISEVEKLKKERQAAIYTLVVQGYIIFFIFVAIMLVMEFKILPLASSASGIGSIESLDEVGGPQFGEGLSAEKLANPFLFLLLTQGIFAGLTIGKLSEGSIKSGLKHSFILTVVAFLVSTGTRVLLG